VVDEAVRAAEGKPPAGAPAAGEPAKLPDAKPEAGSQ
jgi:hypothetical protein